MYENATSLLSGKRHFTAETELSASSGALMFTTNDDDESIYIYVSMFCCMIIAFYMDNHFCGAAFFGRHWIFAYLTNCMVFCH